MLQYSAWTLSPGYNIENGRGGRNVKTHSLNETGLFRRVSQLLLSMIVAIQLVANYYSDDTLQRRAVHLGLLKDYLRFLAGDLSHSRSVS